jgi:phosphohistidine phosphatase SixA
VNSLDAGVPPSWEMATAGSRRNCSASIPRSKSMQLMRAPPCCARSSAVLGRAPCVFAFIVMILYLMRHANAGVIRGNPVLDAKRGLDQRRQGAVHADGAGAGALKVQVDVIVSSPLKRALQTAQFVGTELGYDAKVEISPALGLNGSYTDFQEMLAKYADREGVLVVGHNPNSFSSWAADYRQRRRRHPHAQRLDCPRRHGPPSAAAAVAHRSAHGARHLRQRDKELAAEDLAEVAASLRSDHSSSSAPVRPGSNSR